jgi:hypothetical protein
MDNTRRRDGIEQHIRSIPAETRSLPQGVFHTSQTEAVGCPAFRHRAPHQRWCDWHRRDRPEARRVQPFALDREKLGAFCIAKHRAPCRSSLTGAWREPQLINSIDVIAICCVSRSENIEP